MEKGGDRWTVRKLQRIGLGTATAREEWTSPPCQLCGGSGVVLGKLENLLHIRCKNCGWVYGWMAKESTEAQEEITEAIAKGEQRAGR